MTPSWWSLGADAALDRLASSHDGLPAAEARRRQLRFGPNELDPGRARSRLAILGDQFRSPLLLLLLFAAAASAATGAWVDAGIVTAIVLVSAGIGFRREAQAADAADALQARLQIHAAVVRDGRAQQVPARELVPGDVVVLAAGSLVPADVRLIAADSCHVDEAVLTGESFPVEKDVAPVDAAAPLARRTSCAWLGSNVRSGSARGLVIATGRATAIGGIAGALAARPRDTDLERSIRRFGYLLTTAMLAVVLVVFATNVLMARPPVDTLLFSIALAVGLSPELLPAILAVNLARGSSALARAGVLVRHLGAIENLGSMDVLCTDKTGTLTEGVVRLDGATAPDGTASSDVLRLARINAGLHTGIDNPLDQAIAAAGPAPAEAEKLGEVPYDHVRRRASVFVRDGGRVRIVVKGAFEPTLACCGPLDDAAAEGLRARYRAWTGAGLRVLGVAVRDLATGEPLDRSAERDLRFAGFLTFVDHAKPGAAEAIRDLAALGVTVKLISGDSELVARHIAGVVGLPAARVLTGADLDRITDDALPVVAAGTDLFVEVDPGHKERIVRALRRGGHVVGFLGDGVNDVPAMRAADVSISVDRAVDVARAAAELVAFDRDLGVICEGIAAGRRTFANTIKYVLTTTSANLGNMISMAGASLLLPFLPLTAGQILLNNLLSDVPAVGIADDRVDGEDVARPRRWDMRRIGRVMVQFGLLSTLFDVLTFALLLRGFDAGPELFRTGWFVESLLTELAIALVVRTRRPLWRSRPGRVLLVTSLLMMPLTVALPYVPGAAVVGFVAMPPALALALAGLAAAYVLAAELLKGRVLR